MFATHLRHRVIQFVLLSVVCLGGCGRRGEVGEGPSVQSAKFTKLKAEHDERRQEFLRDVKAASDADAARLVKEFSEYLLPTIDDTLKIAEAEPSTSTGREAAMWVIGHCDSGYGPHVRAAELLLAHDPHLENLPEDLYPHLTGDFHPVYERLLRLGAQSNASRAAKACATFELAEHLVMRADLKTMINASPELDDKRIKNAGAEWLARLKSSDAERDRAEAKKLYERIERDYADVAYRDKNLGDVARKRLLPFTQAYPEIGNPAPDIDAVDLDGTRLALESLRGKVVVISFWASWCGACLNRVHEENQLVEEFADEDFVFMGINGDSDLEDARRAVKEHAIRFRSWWDNPEDKETIVARWGVTSWPTTFVIDQTGTIRFKDLSGADLSRAIRQLLD